MKAKFLIPLAAVFIVLVVLSIVHAQATYQVSGTVTCFDIWTAQTGRAEIWTASAGGTRVDFCCLNANSEYHFYLPNGTYYLEIDTAGYCDPGGFVSTFDCFNTFERITIVVSSAKVRRNIVPPDLSGIGALDWDLLVCPAATNCVE